GLCYSGHGVKLLRVCRGVRGWWAFPNPFHWLGRFALPGKRGGQGRNGRVLARAVGPNIFNQGQGEGQAVLAESRAVTPPLGRRDFSFLARLLHSHDFFLVFHFWLPSAF